MQPAKPTFQPAEYPVDRRFTLWLLLTTSMCLIYLSMRPKAPPPQDPAQQETEVKDPLAAAPMAAKEEEATNNDAGTEGENGNSAVAEISADTKPDNPRTAISLGSMDPSKNFNLLVTISSLGASVEKAELVAQTAPGEFKYRALEQKGGYLGYLGLTPELEITTVPDGSAAALATSDQGTGLQPGDKIVSLNEVLVQSANDVEAFLTKTTVGDQVSVIIERPDQGSRADAQTEAKRQITFIATLSEVPMDVLRTNERAAEWIAGNESRLSLRTTLGSLNGTYIPVGQPSFPSLKDTLQANWAMEKLDVPGGQGVQFRLPLASYLNTAQPRKLDLVKRYRLLPANETDGYILDVETIIENKNETPIKASFRQEGITGLNLEGWWYSVKISPYMFSAAGTRDVMFSRVRYNKHELSTTRQIFDRAKKQPNKPDVVLFAEGEDIQDRSLAYIGIDSQYFNASMLPYQGNDSLTDLRQAACTVVADVETVHRHKIQATNTSFWFDTTEREIAPNGGQLSNRYEIFIGPKDTEILASHGLENAIEYGWFWWVAKPLSAILHFFHGLVQNYGIAIVMLTICVRSLLFPLSRKAMMSSQKMQEQMKVLQPEMKAINEKYAENFEKRNKALQELYAKHNFNPAAQLSGCLPMFVQLPIFMGLYRALSVDISLRQEPLIAGMAWCSNLAGPDMFADWSGWMWGFIGGKGIGWLGPYFNILPIFTVVLFIVQQKMLMPKATDDQQRMTQNMMQVMTIFMGVLFFKVPAGLCIYFITSSMWGLIERQIIKRTTPKPSETPAKVEDESPNNNGKKKSNRKKKNRSAPEETKSKGRLEELKEMLEKPAVRSSTQRGPAHSGKGKRKKKKR